MEERFDIVVVGARCAGSPLATLLAREGLKVALVERATFPRDTLSTHVFEADALAFLDRLGITERLRETGAPFIGRTDNRAGGFHTIVDWPQQPGDVGGLASVRRFILDPILAETAEEAGAEVRMGTNVIGLLENRGRVVGVRVAENGGETELHARLVVGADGRNSTVAKLSGSRKYNLTPNERALYWTFFEDANIGSEPTFVFHRWADRLVLGCAADSGLYQVLVLPTLAELPRFRSDLDRSFMEHARSCQPVANVLDGARRVGKYFGMVRWVGFFREAAGPGWVLAGDAGHFKDPAAGRGIGDAFHQADVLAPAIVGGLDGSGGEVDEAMARWWRWRDDDYASQYWFATDMGSARPLPAVAPEIARRLLARGKFGLVLDMQNHRTKPSEVFTPPRLVGATARLLARRGADRGALLREAAGLVIEDIRRRRQNRRPIYAPSTPVTEDAGPTEMEHDAVAAAR